MKIETNLGASKTNEREENQGTHLFLYFTFFFRQNSFRRRLSTPKRRQRVWQSWRPARRSEAPQSEH